ncbi:MAG: hypothetical protein P4L87_25235 [Formivibrio sp.]|nr:hypothetical protein [Formivibrio sp.]
MTEAQFNAMIASYQRQIAQGAAAIAQLEGVVAGLQAELAAAKGAVDPVNEAQ